MTNLNFLPESLEVLICLSNLIKRLDNLPIGLKELDCSGNEPMDINGTCFPLNMKKITYTYNDNVLKGTNFTVNGCEIKTR